MPDSTGPGTISTGQGSKEGSSSLSAAEADMAARISGRDGLNGGGKALPCPSNPDNATVPRNRLSRPTCPRHPPRPALESGFASAFAALCLGAVAMGISPIFVRFASADMGGAPADVGPFASAFWRVSLCLPLLYAWMRIEEKRAPADAPKVRFSRASIVWRPRLRRATCSSGIWRSSRRRWPTPPSSPPWRRSSSC